MSVYYVGFYVWVECQSLRQNHANYQIIGSHPPGKPDIRSMEGDEIKLTSNTSVPKVCEMQCQRIPIAFFAYHCRAQIGRQLVHDVDDRTTRNTGLSAATGAVLGGIVGHQSGEGAEGAAIGAAAGVPAATVTVKRLKTMVMRTNDPQKFEIFNFSYSVKDHRAPQILNRLGFGSDPALPLNLVYNPNGAKLRPPQNELEADYKREMQEHFDIVFNQLYAITNLPVGGGQLQAIQLPTKAIRALE